MFQDYDYTLLKSSVPFKKGRKFASVLEQQNTIESLHQKNINTVGLEDEGFYACEFYFGVPVLEKERLYSWLRQEDLKY